MWFFDEDSFPLAVSPSLTDLDFLCESGPTVFTIGTHLTTVGTSTPAPHRPAPVIPPGFEPLVAPLPAPAVPPGFLPPGSYHGCATCRHRRPATPYMAGLTGCLRPAGTRGVPRAHLRWEAGAGAQMTRGGTAAALSRDVGAGDAGTRGALRAPMSREVGVGAAGTSGAPGAPLSWEVGVGAAGTHGVPGAALSREAGTTPPPPLPRAVRAWWCLSRP
jgi:hypothetical protein